jgi:N-acetylglucosamine-6-sulfatase
MRRSSAWDAPNDTRSHPAAMVAALVAAAVATEALAGVLASAGAVVVQADGARPNVLLIVTDDQRSDTLNVMPIVRHTIGRHGVTFRNAFVVNPVCCPSRASILTGAYSHTTGVYTNGAFEPYGGFDAFRDRHTIATSLHAAGYATGFAGKYLNGYHSRYVPPGWDSWFAIVRRSQRYGYYYRYDANVDGTIRHFGDAPEDYATTAASERAASFIRSVPEDQPFFFMLTPPSPHAPATPGPGDGDAFRGMGFPKPPSFDEVDVSDKPAYVRAHPRISASRRKALAEFRLDQLRALLSVDRAVGRLVDVLANTGRLEETLIVFTSDNGFLWGEHRIADKNVPYEESIRVPMVVRYDPLTDGRSSKRMVLNIDLAPTIARLAGVELPGADGRSFTSLLRHPRGRWRKAFLVEHYGSHVPTYCAVRTRSWIYVRYATGEREAYSLERDPYELRNRIRALAGSERLRHLSAALHRLCSPTPPGLRLG